MKRLSSLQYISDIHLEHKLNFPKIKRVESTLALLGDIGNPFKDNYKEFLKYTSNKWEHVFLLTGNHEYWQQKYNMDDVDNKIRDLITLFPNITFLNNDKYEYENCTILGTTLWSQINNIPKRKFGDDLYIRVNNKSITYLGINSLHSSSVSWLQKEILNSSHLKKDKSDPERIIIFRQSLKIDPKRIIIFRQSLKIDPKGIIILTHHLPSYKLIIDKYQKSHYKFYHDRFASHLDYMICPPIKAWLCGHSHSINETNINGVHCAINAYGYFPLANRTEKAIYF